MSVLCNELRDPIRVMPLEVPKGVFSRRHWLQVRRVHARTDLAEMVEMQPFGDRSGQRFVNDAVGSLHNELAAAPRADLAAASFVDGSQPKPTRSFESSISLDSAREDALNGRLHFHIAGDSPVMSLDKAAVHLSAAATLAGVHKSPPE